MTEQRSMATTQLPLRFTVYGEAKPAGSKRAFINPRTGKPIVTDDSGKGGRTWRNDVQAAAREAYIGPLLDEPLNVTFTFCRQRPKSHFGTGGNADVLKASAPAFPAKRPDLLKLARAAEDALTGIIWRDDSLIVTELLRGRFADDSRPRLEIEVRPAP